VPKSLDSRFGDNPAARDDRPAAVKVLVTSHLLAWSRQPISHHPIPMVQGQLGESGVDLYRWTG